MLRVLCRSSSRWCCSTRGLTQGVWRLLTPHLWCWAGAWHGIKLGAPRGGGVRNCLQLATHVMHQTKLGDQVTVLQATEAFKVILEPHSCCQHASTCVACLCAHGGLVRALAHSFVWSA
jgi:hypothetical protein